MTSPLKKTETVLQRLVEHLPVPALIYSLEPEHPVVLVNRRFVRTFGYARKDIPTMTAWSEVAIPDLHYRSECMNWWEAEVNRAVAGSGVMESRECRMRAKDGIYHEVIVQGTIIDDAVFMSLVDVTERQLAEEALRVSHERYEQLARQSRSVVWEVDTKGRYTYLSRSAKDVFGYRPEELVGKDVTELHPSEGREKFRHIAGKILKDKERFTDLENPIQTRSGEIIWVSSSGLPVLDERGRLRAYRGMDVDITARKRAQEELQQATERAHDLARQAEEANTAKTEFLANISHEIRTPMNAIIGFANVLAAELTDPRQRHQATVIARSGKSLLRLINDVLDLSAIEAGKMAMHPALFPLSTVLEEVVQLFLPRATEKGLVLTMGWDHTLPPAVMLDEVRLRQILLNLIGNAVKFTDDGMVDVRLSCSFPKEKTSWLDLAIAVADTGIGISEGYKDRLFGAFNQPPGQDHAQYGGTGLGLAISQRLAALMNGELLFEENPDGKGSVFTLILRDVAFVDKAPRAGTRGDGERRMVSRETTQNLVADEVASRREPIESYSEPFKEAGQNGEPFTVPPDMCAVLGEEIRERIKSVSITLRVKQAVDLGKDIAAVAEARKRPDVARIGCALSEAAATFQINNMKRILGALVES